MIWHGRGRGFHIVGEPGGQGADRHRTGHGDLLRNAWRNCSIPQPALPPCLHQLYPLRPALHADRTLPYDRANTSMAKFTQCPACQREYDDTPTRAAFTRNPMPAPSAARAEPVRYSLAAPLKAVIRRALGAHRGGTIVAVKGIGGFHLVCDARNAAAVARLRAGKPREEKPFAVMVRDALRCAPRGIPGGGWRAAGTGERPIVLLRQAPVAMRSCRVSRPACPASA